MQDAQLAVNPFKTLAKNVKELFTSEKDSDKLEKKIGRVGESAAESADLVGNFAGQMSSMFDALGNEGMADTIDVYKRQDEGKATTIFNQIKKLAVASPFGVMDLNQYAKQLSAYSIPVSYTHLDVYKRQPVKCGVKSVTVIRAVVW